LTPRWTSPIVEDVHAGFATPRVVERCLDQVPVPVARAGATRGDGQHGVPPGIWCARSSQD